MSNLEFILVLGVMYENILSVTPMENFMGNGLAAVPGIAHMWNSCYGNPYERR